MARQGVFWALIYDYIIGHISGEKLEYPEADDRQI
jgi:hypothetical protein